MNWSISRRTFLAGSAAVGLGAVQGNMPSLCHAEDAAFNNNPLFGRNDPSKYMSAQFPHGGAGTVSYMELTPRDKFKTQFLFLHRGVLMPKSGLGEHVHRRMEEMYIILDGCAQYTVNGRTAAIPAPGMAPCQMGSSHGIYNHTDKPVEFMNIGVSYENRTYDALDFAKQNDLADAIVESPPPFIWTVLDKRLLDRVPSFYNGKGDMYRRVVMPTECFRTKWGFVNHYLLPPGNSVGYHRHEVMEEVYYILSGEGRMTVDDATYNVKAGDAATCLLHGAHGLYNNSGKDMELLSIAVPLEKGKYDGTPLGDDLTKR
ncbi:cupin domain-containing protein [bacterium]|nr:cupin domain-containing protein [bacterium]